jgi:hypothetical protein
MAIGPQETDAYFASLARVLPEEITDPGWEHAMTRDAFLGTIRSQLLPYITCGPDYLRAADDNLAAAVREFRRGFGEEFLIWLQRATQASKGHES